MKKFVSALILATAVSFSGCGNSTDFSSAASLPGIAGPGVVVPPVPAPPVAVDGFFVDAALGSNTTGSFTGGLPFQTIQAAVAAAPAGSTITVRPGNYSGTVSLLDNQILQGEAGGVRPETTGPIILADGNTVDFMRIDGTTSSAIDAIGQASGTVTNCEIANITGGVMSGGVDAEESTGTWFVSNNTLDQIDGIAVDFTATGTGIVRAEIVNNTITNSGLSGIGLLSQDTGQLSASIIGNTLVGNGLNATVEVIVSDDSVTCLDIEDNTNDDVYAFFESADPLSLLQIEQLATLTDAQPGGAGNTGTVNIGSGIGSNPPTDVINGFCGF